MAKIRKQKSFTCQNISVVNICKQNKNSSFFRKKKRLSEQLCKNIDQTTLKTSRNKKKNIETSVQKFEGAELIVIFVRKETE